MVLESGRDSKNADFSSVFLGFIVQAGMSEKVVGKPGRLKFLKSASDLTGCPEDLVPEVAIAGRSNAGKSTFINGLQGGAIAKVSGKPGKTRLLNFFEVGDNYRLVDMPGYGFASVSASEMKQWQSMIEGYLSLRGNLRGLILIMDIRRNWTQDEQMLVDFMSARELPSIVVLTKADKLKRGPGLQRKKKLESDSGLPCFLCSQPKKQGFYEVENFIFDNWVESQGVSHED